MQGSTPKENPPKEAVMEASSACQLVNQLVFKPGWRFEAEESDRFEGAIKVTIHYPARRSDREDAAAGYPTKLDLDASFLVLVDMSDDTRLYYQVDQLIAQIEEHERRESLRVRPTMWAPFHPHRADGMRRWAEVSNQGCPDRACQPDLAFGVA